MFIEKNGKNYEITELKKCWSVVWRAGALTADFQVSKNICKTVSELKAYIQSEKMF